MTRRTWLLPAMAAVASLCVPTAFSSDLRILYAEPMQIAVATPPGAQKATVQTSARIAAFGRTFDLVLEDNSTLLRRAPARIQQQLGSLKLLRGTLRDVPGSWVRFTVTERGYEGAFWDGSELYAVTSRQHLEPALLAPLAPSASSSAIYRLSDTQGMETQSCAVDADTTVANPLSAYRRLVSELKSITAAAAATGEIEIAVVADFEATSRWGSSAGNAMIDRMNVVDGIFSSQVGVAIVPTDFITHAADTDPFSSADPVTLLQQFADYRSGSATVRSRGLAHLFTGRALNGTTVGIAYLGALCQSREGAGLTEVSSFIDSALVTAHEIGHNFGASHDAESGSACSAEPRGYLMEPTFNGSSTFSQCSVQSMQPYIASASCITSSQVHDVAVDAPADEMQVVVNQPFEFVADVTATGDSPSRNIIVSGAFPSGTLIDSASLDGASCSITGYGSATGTDVNCATGTLEAGQSRRLRVSARISSVGEPSATIRVSASNDANPGNNSKTVRIIVAAEQDLRIVATPQPFVATLGEPFDMTFDVTGSGIQSIPNLRIQILDTQVRAQTAQVAGGTCTIVATDPQVTCELGSLAAAETRRIVVRALPVSTGTNTGGRVYASQQGNSSWSRFRTFTQHIRAARDVSARIAPEFRRAAISEATEWTLEVRSNGVYDSSNVSVRLDAASQVVFTIDDAGGGTCTTAPSPECTLGTVAAGAFRTIRFRTRADVAVETSVRASIVQPAPDDVPGNDQSVASLVVTDATDVRLQTDPASRVLYDGRSSQLLDGFVTSTGAYAAELVSLSVNLPAEFDILSASFGSTPCTVRTAPQKGVDCTLPRLEVGNTAHFWLAAVAPAPGVYSGTITTSARGDTNPSNNSATLTFDVRPAVDGSITAPPEGPVGSVGSPMETVLTVATGRYALPDARVQISWSGPFNGVAADWPGGTCSSNAAQLICDIGTVEAGVSIPVSVRFTPAHSSPASLNAALISGADTDQSNNWAYMSFYVYPPTDLSLGAASSTVRGTLDTILSMPTISVTATSGVSAGTFVEFSFNPAQAEIIDILSGCQRVIDSTRCEIGHVDAGRTVQIGATLVPRITGTVPVTVRVWSINDTTAGNNEQVIVLNVDPPAPPPPPPAPAPAPPSNGSSGGGGAIGLGMMLALLLLRALAALCQAKRSMAES